MKIHYKKDRESSDKIIADVIYIGVIDGSEPVSVVLKDNRELTIRLDRIEAIVDDSIFQKESDTFHGVLTEKKGKLNESSYINRPLDGRSGT